MVQVAGVKGHGHGVACGLVQGAGRGKALGDQQHGRAGGGVVAGQIAHQVPQPGLAATLQKQLVGPAARLRWCDLLQVPQLARPIAQRHQQPATGRKAHAVGLHTLAHQVRAGAALAGFLPLRRRLVGCARLRSIGAGLFLPLPLCPQALAFGQLYGRGRGRVLPVLRHDEAVLGREVQQRAHGHTAARLDAAPGGRHRLLVVAVGVAGAPCVEQVKARAIRVFGLDGHAHPRPFVTGQVRRDVRQCGADQFGSDWGVRCGH